MTTAAFTETDHPRATDGTFVRKTNVAPTSPLSPAEPSPFDAAMAQLEAINEDYRELDDACESIAEKLIPIAVPDNIQTLSLGWSDQGDYLTIEAAHDANGNAFDWEWGVPDDLETVETALSWLKAPSRVFATADGNAFTWERQGPSDLPAAAELFGELQEKNERRWALREQSEAASVAAFAAGVPDGVASASFEWSDQEGDDGIVLTGLYDTSGNVVLDAESAWNGGDDDGVFEALSDVVTNIYSPSTYFTDPESNGRFRWTRPD